MKTNNELFVESNHFFFCVLSWYLFETKDKPNGWKWSFRTFWILNLIVCNSCSFDIKFRWFRGQKNSRNHQTWNNERMNKLWKSLFIGATNLIDSDKITKLYRFRCFFFSELAEKSEHFCLSLCYILFWWRIIIELIRIREANLEKKMCFAFCNVQIENEKNLESSFLEIWCCRVVFVFFPPI